MKIRSKPLFAYLCSTGAIHGTEETILAAKRHYRALYKKKWKQQRIKCKEVRPIFNLKEFDLLTIKARKAGLKPATFARQVILQAIDKNTLIPQKETLLQVLQYLSIACIELSKTSIPKSTLDPLEKAEQMLLKYIHDI